MLQNIAEASLTDWASFYVITGSAAAALTGLQFVVMALIAAVLLPRNETAALFLTGAVALLLLFIGIHNAWDTVTYIMTEQVLKKDQSFE